jgi:hypothetical protein
MHTSCYFYIAFGTKFHSVLSGLGRDLGGFELVWALPRGPKTKLPARQPARRKHMPGSKDSPKSRSFELVRRAGIVPPALPRTRNSILHTAAAGASSARRSLARAHSGYITGRGLGEPGGFEWRGLARCFAWPLWRWVNRRGGPGTRQTQRASTL